MHSSFDRGRMTKRSERRGGLVQVVRTFIGRGAEWEGDKAEFWLLKIGKLDGIESEQDKKVIDEAVKAVDKLRKRVKRYGELRAKIKEKRLMEVDKEIAELNLRRVECLSSVDCLKKEIAIQRKHREPEDDLVLFCRK